MTQFTFHDVYRTLQTDSIALGDQESFVDLERDTPSRPAALAAYDRTSFERDAWFETAVGLFPANLLPLPD